MLIPADKMDEAINISKETVLKLKVGDPQDEGISMGPVVNKNQFLKIKEYISKGIEEGATLVTGREETIKDNEKGYFISPTIFANVTKDMTISKEEIFGPVLSIIGYHSEEEAIDIANDSIYGLSGYISSNDTTKAKQLASKLRTGMVHINYAPVDQSLPFGGYKMSGNGREWGEHGIEDFLETKAIIGINNNT
jgi:aldehyde dehydrogenase (NAD+)